MVFWSEEKKIGRFGAGGLGDVGDQRMGWDGEEWAKLKSGAAGDGGGKDTEKDTTEKGWAC